MQLCPNCGEENPDKFRLCGFCGAQLAPALPAQEVRKTVTIVFADLKGSTSMGEKLDSEAVREVMSRYFDAMRTELERHGGIVEKYIGDAVMAVFGLPKLHEDDAIRAVRAAAGMQRALADLNDELDRRWGVRLANRTGVNTGEVVAGDPASGQRLVTGDTVNVAARLEQAAGEREVLLGELTYRLVHDAVEVEPVEPLELKGKAERVPAYRLLSVAETGEGWARRHDAPMVGREAELALLQSMFEEALEGKGCRLVTVVGDAGVGKSRLNDEFLQSIGRRARVLRGRCLSYGDGITFWPLAEAVRQAGAIREDDPPEAARAKLASVADGDEVIVARVASAIGLGEDQFPIEELFWGARKFLELLARETPLVVLFDDIHWAEETFLELIEHLVESVEDAPLLLLCPARHDLLERRPEWAETPRAARVVLEPLTAADTELIVENLLGQAGIAEEARARIVAAAEGNPLFVEQVLSMLIDEGLLRFEEGRWAAASDLADLSVPPTIQALIASRLDRLSTEEKAVVEPASVIGHVFAQDAVQALAPDLIQPQVPAHLAELTGKQFVRPDLSAVDEVRFRFNHVLIREAAYGGLLKRARATFHERFVEWADRVNHERGREIEYEEILGYHLEQAFRYLDELGPLDEHGRELGRSAAARLASAGRRAFGRGDMRAASNLLGRAVGLLPEQDPNRLELLPDLAEALVETGEFAPAETYLEEALTAAERLGDERLSAHATVVRLLARLYAGGEDESWGEQVLHETPAAIEALEQSGDDVGLAKAHRLVCIVHGTRCQFGDFLASAEQEIHYAMLAGERRQQARAVTAYAFAAVYGPTPVTEALQRCEEVLRLAAGDRRSEGITMCLLADLHAMAGDFDEGRRVYTAGRELLEDAGAGVMAASAAIDSGAVEFLAGDTAAAERELRRGYDALSAIGETYFFPTVATELAHVLCAAGRDEEAIELTVTAEELAAPDDVATQARWRCARAKALVRAGREEEALTLAGEGVELLRQTDAPVWQADALVDLAEVHRACGLLEDALSQADEALALYEAKGHLIGSSRARALAAACRETPAPV